MSGGFAIRPVARYHGDFPDKFGIPRQAGVVPELEGLVIFEPEYRDREALRGIEGFGRLWLLWRPRCGRRGSAGTCAWASSPRARPFGRTVWA